MDQSTEKVVVRSSTILLRGETQMSSLNGTSMMNMLRLSSQSLPTGAFSYSQGMEWLVDTKRIQDEETVHQWIASILYGPYANYELPILRTMLEAWKNSDHQILAELNQDYLITRETSEIQKETLQMGYALKGVIHEMSIISSHSTEFLMQLEYVTFPLGFSFCSFITDLSVEEMLTSHVWSFIENQILVAIKVVPLGQNAGQRLLNRLIPVGEESIRQSMTLSPDDWSNFSPLQAIASAKHETQYSRLFRS